MSDYKPTIGIECHVQLKTKTKLFARVGNDAREAPSNSLISHICLGMPGALPYLNMRAIELAILAAAALKTRASNFSAFDRKHYFYPDLPKGYQISQLYKPIILGGEVKINVDGKQKVIAITRAHLEEDAGKSTHPDGKNYSLVDLNRAGTPLLEIVSEPQINSASEAKAYARELYLLMKYAGVSEADLYYGNMRFDVNVSVSKDKNLGKRTETKNLNSFRSVEKAVDYEVKRQVALLEKGQQIVQETRGWDDAKQKTFSQRSKEDAHDYRYMPDPDIPPVVLEDSYIDEILKTAAKPVDEIRTSLETVNINDELIETILDNYEICHMATKLINMSDDKRCSQVAVQWLGQLAPKIASDNNVSPSELKLDSVQIIKLSKMFVSGKISSTQSKIILEKILLEGVDPEEYAQSNDMLQVSDSNELIEIVKKVLADNNKAADDIKNGEMKAIGFLVGQVMKESKGKANPGLAQKLIKEQLGV